MTNDWGFRTDVVLVIDTIFRFVKVSFNVISFVLLILTKVHIKICNLIPLIRSKDVTY